MHLLQKRGCSLIHSLSIFFERGAPKATASWGSLDLNAEFAKRSEMHILRISPCPTAYMGTPRVSFADRRKALNTRNYLKIIYKF